MSRADELRAELELLELEEAFVAAKADGSVTADMKLALREKRRTVREARSRGVAASPATVTAKTDVPKV